MSHTDEGAWQKLAEKTRKGAGVAELARTADDGWTIEPLYTERHVAALVSRGAPGAAPFVRGARPEGRAAFASRLLAADPGRAGASLAVDVAGGAAGAWVVADRAVRGALGADAPGLDAAVGEGGVALGGEAELAAVLGALDPAAHALVLDVGASGVEALAAVDAWLDGRGTPAAALDLVLLADPHAALAELGALPFSAASLAGRTADAARAAARFRAGSRTVTADARVHQQAGATPGEAVGLALASAAAHLRAGEAHGVDAEGVLGALALALEAHEEVLTTVAMLRAARLGLAKLAAACGAGPAAPRVVATTSWRALTTRDPYDNVLRGAAQCFGLLVGGADVVSVRAFDEALGESDRLARRVARNTPLVLAEEGHADRVADPAGGSYYVEAATDAIARAAWAVLQEVEAAGGLAQALASGWVRDRLGRSAAARAASFAEKKRTIVGVTAFALKDEAPLVRPAWRREGDPAPATRRFGAAAEAGALAAPALAMARDAAAFEAPAGGTVAATPSSTRKEVAS